MGQVIDIDSLDRRVRLMGKTMGKD